MLERDGVVLTTVVPDNRKHTLLPKITEHFAAGLNIQADELARPNAVTKSVIRIGLEHWG